MCLLAVTNDHQIALQTQIYGPLYPELAMSMQYQGDNGTVDAVLAVSS